MKLINLFKSKTGKMALSAMQAVGLSAAVGVAGILADDGLLFRACAEYGFFLFR